jgi:hypothetical protein
MEVWLVLRLQRGAWGYEKDSDLNKRVSATVDGLMVEVVSINEPATCWVLVWGALSLVFLVVEVVFYNKALFCFFSTH